ncbi:hypothetical protein [Nocardioides sp. zg-1230]|uniref:hypothetical protein n=1 Tax=Nocardioides sp. zg-1230 TaxID=2736601 RepID=UPI001C13132D|nr:hypothetical protein [Nocardioides sp. zg-1230]
MLRERLVAGSPRVAQVLQQVRAQTPGQLTREIELNRVLTGTMLARQLPASVSSLREVEFRVFSQFGDDGIIQYLLQHVDAPESFIEFGVETYRESNTRFLLVKDNWRGLVIDGSEANVASITTMAEHWRHDLTAVASFITRENINDLFTSAGFTGEVGLLSIDIDGNDYWVWEAIEVVSPVVVVAEYNSVFGPEAKVTVPYAADFTRRAAHHSHLFFGASLGALCDLAERKGYAFVGSNSNGNNAYFVRLDQLGDLRALSAAEGYVESRFRESRDASGNLTHLSGSARLDEIAHLVVQDLTTGSQRPLRDAVG